MAEHNEVFNNDGGGGRSELSKAPPDRVHGKMIAKRSAMAPEKGFFQKGAELFLADDVDSIGKYVLEELVVPTIKDVIVNFVNALLWGSRNTGSSYRDYSRQRTNYSMRSTASRVGIDRERERDRVYGRDRERDREEYDDKRLQFNVKSIPFKTKKDADDILEDLEDYLEEYGKVSVGYLLEVLGESPKSDWATEYYGWKSLRGAYVHRVGKDVVLELPRIIRFD